MSKLLRKNMECFFCGRTLKKISKKEFRKWDLGDLLFYCKNCEKRKLN